MSDSVQRYKRRRIWVNARFQARYTALVLAVATAILGVLGALYAATLAEERRLMGVSRLAGHGSVLLDNSAADFDKDLMKKVEEGDSERMQALIAVAAGLVIVLAYVGVRLTFRAAGPVHAISGMLRAMARGDFGAPRALRRGDDFRFLEEDVFALRATLRVAAQEDLDLLHRVRDAMKDAPDQGALVDEITQAARAKLELFGLAEPGRAGEGGGTPR